MNTGVFFIYALGVPAIFLLVRLLIRFFINRDIEDHEITDVILNPEELERHAADIARKHIIDKRTKSFYSLEWRMNNNFKLITSVYMNLNEYVKSKKRVAPASEWLLDNFYIIEEQVKEIRQNLSKKYYYQLPRLKSGSLKGFPRVYAIALELVSHTDGRFDDKLLINFITAYQSQALLSSGELWAIPLMIRMALIEHIRHVCDKLIASQQQWYKAEKLAEHLLLHKNSKPEELLQLAKEYMKGIDKITPSFGEHLLNMLKKHGLEVAPIIHYIDKRLSEQHTNGESITQLEHNEQAIRQVSIGNSITSLKFIATLDWTEIFESLSKIEHILRQDPEQIYSQMDFQSRDYYRHEIERLAKKSRISEIQIAREAVECAVEGNRHVGYYLLGNQKNLLRRKIGQSDEKKDLNSIWYLTSITALTMIIYLLLVYYVYNLLSSNLFDVIVAAFVLLLPASDIAVSVVNWIVTRIKPPAFLPKLELKEGIPDTAKTIVVIPTLLPNDKRALKLVEQLEEYYLANREKNLYFALVGDFKDHSEKEMSGDQEIIQYTTAAINQLNERYSTGEDIFYYFHRERVFSKAQNRWMGWERKRGALVEFNSLLKGDRNTGFSTIIGDISSLQNIKYVITIDADTKLSMETGKKLIGTIMHPLNKAVVDKASGVVVEGYGLLQPRINVDIVSANASAFSRIFAGQGGIDIYTNAVSDVYQDLFGEGIFTGKGIYDLDIFHELLKDAIPDNTVLSHDLLEGSYVRTGLVTDIELIDGFPSKYNSYIMRLHRWVRGDWQLISWLFPSIKNREGKYIKNPLANINKWKILDNLRRSLSSSFSMLLIIAALAVFPGSTLVWLFLVLLINALPIVISLADLLAAGLKQPFIEKSAFSFADRITNVILQVLLILSFLPYNAYMMLNAIFKTLGRVFITKRNMLEWVTAADMEHGLKNHLESYMQRMWICPVSGIAIFTYTLYFRFEAIYVTGLLFILWSLAPITAYKISKAEQQAENQLNKAEINELRRISRKTWSFFEEFVGALDNYLPPDNYQENPPNGIAHRTSPTNVGLLLMSILTARDFGYISLTDMLERLNKTIATIEKMSKWKGHLYNWYDTITLEVLRPKYISTVDSGNFIGYLITLRQGLQEFLNKPVIDLSLACGIKDTLELAKEEHENIEAVSKTLENTITSKNMTLADWSSILTELGETNKHKRPRWGYKLHKMTVSHMKDLKDFISWLSIYESFDEIFENKSDFGVNQIKELLESINKGKSLLDMTQLYKRIILLCDEAAKKMQSYDTSKTEYKAAIEWLNMLKSNILPASSRLGDTINEINSLMMRVQQIIDATKFQPLFDNKRKLFSIGYNEEEEQPTKSYYDLLASEARQSSFISIARGEVKKEHWFMLDRTLTNANGCKGLVSWTGTMFEYLMPLLIMKDYDNTLLNETYRFVVRAQREYGRKRHVPWGVSESGYYSFDFRLNYQYKAFGIPSLGLKRGLINDTVIAPYATLLSLMVEPKEAFNNLLRLKQEGMEAAYGFYEAVDYTPERLSKGKKSSIVQSYMAHHQGMAFLALNNLINDNIMQKRFHNEPIIKAAEILLQEKVPSKVIFAKDYKEKIEPFEDLDKEDLEYSTTLGLPQKQMPECHILSNGSYSVMLTDDGTGYSRYNNLAVTRWRDEAVNNKYGTFFYIQDIDTSKVWASSFNPNLTVPDKYKVIFAQDKVTYIRTDDKLDTQTDIVVSPEDNIEVRRLQLTNHGQQVRTIEITSYFEVVLADQSADVAHPAFSNLFIKTEYLQKHNALIAYRRPREQSKQPILAIHSINITGELVGGIQYETDRSKFIGRGRTLINPMALEPNHPLSNTVGPVLDPVMSIRARVKIQPGETAKLCYITGIPSSYDNALQLIEKYHEAASVDRALELAWTRGQVELNFLNLKHNELELYRQMLSHIIFVSPLKKAQESYIKKNIKGQSGLWAYGISGDLPIVLAAIKNAENADLVRELLKAHEYWRIKGFYVDLVLINTEAGSYTQPLYNLLQDIVSVSHARDLREKSGGVFIRQGHQINEEDKTLLYTSARIAFRGDKGTLSAQLKLKEAKYANCSRLWEADDTEYPAAALAAEQLTYSNGYGGFSEDGKEYVIQLKDAVNTPVPWINVISNGKFGFQVSESGSGYAWAENSRENKLTPWANDPTVDASGEIIYIRDEASGSVWNITPQPIRGEGQYKIRHGFGYSIFERNYMGFEHQMIQFTPMDSSVKLYKLIVKNVSNKKRSLSAFYYVRPVMGVNEQQTAYYTYSDIYNNETLLIRNSFNSDFPDRILFIDSSIRERYYTGDRREFIGRFGTLSKPEALCRERLSNNTGAGMDSCACIQTLFELDANEEKELVFILGQADSLSDIASITSRYRSIKEVNKALEETVRYWDNILSAVKIQTPDISMNYLLNGWLLYQTLSCRMWARSALYQSGGAYGFRDQLQDSMALVYIQPEITKNQILYHSSHQFFEGDVQHWWHPVTDKGIRTKFSDDLLWMPYVVLDYINSTGDWSILDEQTSYLDEECLKDDEDERYNKPCVSELKTSLYEHCIRAIERSLKFGPHGIPLMGSGDWNDGMSTVGNKGKGESVWLGWFIYSILIGFSDICKKQNDQNRVERYLNIAKEIIKAIEENAWDGNWYRRAYFDNGLPLGSAENTECRIDSLAQSWAVISGAGRADRIKEAFEAVEHYLINKDEGIVLLLTPPFDEGDLEPGYIKGYLPGVRENGGQYTHAAVWVALAYAKMGMGDKAYELYNMLSPINHAKTSMEVARYKVEPYVMAADVYAVAPHTGRGGWTWYTGAAGWMYRVGLQSILGFNKLGDRLIIDPCIPKDWSEYSIEYKYKETLYTISVKNPSKISKGIEKLILDGKEQQENHIKLINDRNNHTVELIMGCK